MRIVQHNVKRVPHSKEAIQARKEREKWQIAEYLALTNSVLSHVRSLATACLLFVSVHSTEKCT